MAAALATCDMAALIKGVQTARGWSQGELARAVGYSQSWVSRVVNGQQSLTIDQVRELALRLAIPIHLLRFTNSTVAGKGSDPARRRDVAVAAAALALPAVSTAGDIDEATAPTLRAITGGQRRLDALLPARDLAAGAVAHAELTGATLARARHTPFAPSIAAAASEAAGFAAWLHADMGDTGSARGYYRSAVERARQAGDRLLDAYMLGSLAALEIDTDDPESGLGLACGAGRRLSSGAHPTALAWAACVRALAHATLGHGNSAAQEFRAAEDEVARYENAEPPWPWVFAFDDAKVAAYRALAGVRLHRPHEARTAFAEAFSGARPSAKQSAVLMAELASAYSEAGDVDEAFRLAAEALSAGIRLRSEKVISRVRRFRRGYRGPNARCVMEFDEHLATALSG